MNTVIFDLDGTISDPAVGITRSINHALIELGLEARPEKALQKYIGPHLQITFSELIETHDESIIAHAITLYRQRYMSVGYQENHLYEGIKEVLAQLQANGSSLCIATTKYQETAIKVLKFLEVDSFFTQVHGCGLNRSKPDLLRDIMADTALAQSPMVMIGDRNIDFKAASEVNMPSIAVRWGYGDKKELALATAIAEKPTDLPEAIINITQQHHL